MQQPGGIVTRFLTALRGQPDDLDPGFPGNVPSAPSSTPLAGMGEALVEQLPDPVLVVTLEGKILKANHAARALFGPESQGRMLPVAIRVPAVHDAVAALASGRVQGPVDFTLPGPLERHLTLRTALIDGDGDGAGRLILLLFHDTTTIKRAEQMRVDFVANASHELKTPLTSLIGFIETLQGPARDDPAAQARFLDIMAEQAGRMGRLIADLLSLSRIELNEHLPPTNTVDLGGVVREVVALLGPQAAAAKTPLAVTIAPNLAPVAGDRDELIQVFQNLIDNAIKYGHPGEAVTITAQTAPGASGRVMVSVEDRGDGIPREHLPRLTERFYRVDAVRSRESGGTGLGLAIVKHIVNRHRGVLVIDSTVGQGSRFSVVLPEAQADMPPPSTVTETS